MRLRLPKLINAASANVDIVLANGSKAVSGHDPIFIKFKIGLLKHQLTEPGPDFLELLDESALEVWESNGL
jgi:hypothetical protein